MKYGLLLFLLCQLLHSQLADGEPIPCDNKNCCLSCCEKAKDEIGNSFSKNSCGKGCGGSCGTNKSCRVGLSFLETGSVAAVFDDEEFYCVLSFPGETEGYIHLDDVENTPTADPTKAPVTPAPTPVPTESPSVSPETEPTDTPTEAPTEAPTGVPTGAPTRSPTSDGTANPTTSPTDSPTMHPTVPTPSADPVPDPTSDSPTAAPTLRAESTPIVPEGSDGPSSSMGNVAFVAVAAGGAVALIATISLVLFKRRSRGRMRPLATVNSYVLEPPAPPSIPPSNYMFEPADALPAANSFILGTSDAITLASNKAAEEPTSESERFGTDAEMESYGGMDAAQHTSQTSDTRSKKRPNRYDGIGQPVYIKNEDTIDAWI